MGQVGDYRKYKEEKIKNHNIITSPIHLACKLSNDEAVRQLIDQ